MTLDIRRTGQKDYGRFIKALICGDPGSGKTLLSSTWPNPIFASAEGGLMSIADRNIPYTEIRSSIQLLQLKNVLDQSAAIRQEMLGTPVDTVVIDTIDEVQRIFVKERLEETGKEGLTLPDWGWLGDQMKALITGFRNLDMHVIFTCHIKETKDEELGRVVYKPGLQGAIADQIPGYVDLALFLKGRLETAVMDGEARKILVRSLQTFPDLNHSWVKDRSGKLPMDFAVNFDDDFTRMNELIFSTVNELPDQEASTLVVTSKTIGLAADEVVEQEETKQSTIPVASAPVAVSSPDAQTSQVALDDMRFTADCPKGLAECLITDDQADLSKIRFRKVLCRDCFVDNKR